MHTLISSNHLALYYNPAVCLFGVNFHWITHYGLSFHLGPLSLHVNL
jgi:hypothetical protein